MAYQLQAELQNIMKPALPPACATNHIMALPLNTTQGYFQRHSTPLYGTAPFMAGGGAPAHLIELEDSMRPQSTKSFKKNVYEPQKRNVFPWQNMSCAPPVSSLTMPWVPTSTRANIQNGLFNKRYGGCLTTQTGK